MACSRPASPTPRVGVAIGDHVLDLWELEQDCRLVVGELGVFSAPTLNPFMALGPKVWSQTRARISELLRQDHPELRDNEQLRARALVPMAQARLHLPIAVAGYTDFYSSKEHATNVGVMFRGKDNALQPNWLHMPIGYNGRASTVVVSGTKVRRPRGQLKPPSAEVPAFGPCKRLDFELEMGVVIGQPSAMGEMLSERAGGGDDLRLRAAERLERARYPAMGICAARAVPGQGVCDLDQPVGGDARGAGAVPGSRPGAGSGAAALSEADAAEQLRSAARRGPARRADERGAADLPHQFQIHVLVVGAATGASRLLRLRHECRRSPGERHHPGPEKDQRGSLLEISWNGTEPVELAGGVKRTFLEDGDSLAMRGWCQGDGYRVGFGEVEGTILPAE